MKRYLILTSLIISIVWILITAFSKDGLRGYLTQLNEKHRIEKLNRKLIEKNAELTLNIERLKRDDVYLEWLVREEFGFVKPEEVIFKLEE